jgi:dUTP pyrophosphatase
MKIRIVNHSSNPLPAYETAHSAGMDIRASLQEPLMLFPGKRALVPTGLFVEIPFGYEAQIRPRSGLAIKHGITVLNSPGTIDSDFRGEVNIILINLGDQPFEICHGDRIAQMIVSKYEKVEWHLAEELSNTGRGKGGFGHTGK